MSTRKNTNPVEREKFAARLQAAIESKGLNQSKFATLLGVRQGHVNAWFAAKSMPSKLSMVIIAQALTVNLDWLRTGEGVAGPITPEATELTAGQSTQYTEAIQPQALAWNEPPEMYTNDPKRIELLIKVKRLIMVADDHTVGALSMNVDEFMRRYEKKDDDKEE